MENAIVDLFQLNETADMPVDASENKFSYISCIKIHGKPILPPLLTEERRHELRKYKQKAIEIELKLIQQKKGINQISSEVSSIVTLPPSRQSTPARPVSLNLNEKYPGQTYVLSKSRTEGSLDQYSKALNLECKTGSSHKSSRRLEKTFRSTLEQRLAMSENVMTKNKLNKYQRSPIVEEQLSDKSLEPEMGRTHNLGRWSPLKVEPISSLRIELTSRDSQESDDVLEISQEDSSQGTPETITQSPNLMRQNSYTLLTPSPALLSFLESQRKEGNSERTRTGRKTWDVNGARKSWHSNDRETEEDKSQDGRGSSDEGDVRSTRKYSSSLDDFSGLENGLQVRDYNDCSGKDNSLENDSGTSPDSYSPKKNVLKQSKVKCKVKGKKTRSVKNVPTPKTNEKVPSTEQDKRSISQTQGAPDFVPSGTATELSDLSSLLLKMKVDHERQKKELEEKQQSEMKELEMIFQKREAELLGKVDRFPKKSRKSIYSETLKEAAPNESDTRVMGDGSHNQDHYEKSNSFDGKLISHYVQSRRPHSAKDYHHQLYSFDDDSSRRARSMDFIEGNQDTDLDISFQDDFMQSRDTTLNNEYVIESDSMSNFSSRSSTVSSDNRPDEIPIKTFRKYQEVTSEEYAKYNRAATIITAAARGFLTRRLLRTAHVQGLITTLKDAITCATQLHTASDIADSDIDLMRRLGRQIEAAWDAVYVVFFNTETSAMLQLIAADRERLKTAVSKTPITEPKKKRISSATRKSLDRKKAGSIMSKSQTSNGTPRVRMCTKLTASYPGPYFSQKLK